MTQAFAPAPKMASFEQLRRRERLIPKCRDCGAHAKAFYICDYATDRRVATYTTCGAPICDTCRTKKGSLDLCKTHAKGR